MQHQDQPLLVYVAGPYKAQGRFFRTIKILMNILRARRVAKFIWGQGHYAICPHLNTAFFSERVVSRPTVLDGYLEILGRCDAMVLVKQWTHSEGTWIELAYAKEHNIPVYTFKNWMKRGTVPDNQLMVSLRKGRAMASTSGTQESRQSNA